jgi:hypothetical protein
MRQKFQLDIPRPIDRVFDFLADFRHTPEWNELSLRVQKIDDSPIREGTRFRESHKKLGDLTVEIVKHDRPHVLSFKIVGGQAAIAGAVAFKAVGTDTRVDLLTDTESRSFFGTLGSILGGAPAWLDPSAGDLLAKAIVRRVEPADPHVATSSAGPPVAAILISRLPRGDDPDWSRARSWLGGRPRLGSVRWPRAGDGKVPMTHVAWIDLRHLHERAGANPLPNEGALAFFIVGLPRGCEGAVLHVPDANAPDTDPPQDAPPAYVPYGEVFPFDATVGERTFPRWPVELTRLVAQSPAEEGDLRIVVDRHMKRRQYSFDTSAARQALGDTRLPTYWQSARQLADRLSAAVSRLDTLRASKAKLHNAAEALASFDAGRAAFIAFVDDVEHWAGRRLMWDEMTPGDIDELDALLTRAKGEFGAYARAYVPNAVKNLDTAALRTLAHAENPAAWKALPAPVRELLDRDYRLPTNDWHQMFGRSVEIQDAAEMHRDDHLLLQLVYDDLMEWFFGDVGAFQFWISPDDLKRQRWSRVQVTFESH